MFGTGNSTGRVYHSQLNSLLVDISLLARSTDRNGRAHALLPLDASHLVEFPTVAKHSKRRSHDLLSTYSRFRDSFIHTTDPPALRYHLLPFRTRIFPTWSPRSQGISPSKNWRQRTKGCPKYLHRPQSSTNSRNHLRPAQELEFVEPLRYHKHRRHLKTPILRSAHSNRNSRKP